MMFQKLVPVVLALLWAASSGATTITRAGTFATDDQVEIIPFTLASNSTLYAYTTSYASGGFDPTLALFNADKLQALLDTNEDSGAGTLDSSLHDTLDAGDYLLALTESPNLAIGPTFTDGFLLQGSGNFTGGPFLDLFGNQRTGDWAVDIVITPASVSAVPEPGTFLLAGFFLIVLGACPLRAKRSHSIR